MRLYAASTLAVLLTGAFPPAIRADLRDTTADAVLGQPDFGSLAFNWPDGVPAAANLSLVYAAAVAIAPDGRLYVSDPANNRVLSWPSARHFATAAAADMVFGQPDFSTADFNHGGVSATSLALPQGLAVDDAGNLWVADAFNSRVLRYDNPPNDVTPAVADLVIGQPDFAHNEQNLGNGENGTNVALPDGLQFPGRVAIRGQDVFVADSGNSRVLMYHNPTSNKPLADRVWGQFGSFTCRAKNNDGMCHGDDDGTGGIVSAESLFNPIGLTVGPDGRLWIADWNNHRVLRFDPPFTDATAAGVLGQADFDSRAIDSGGVAFGGLELPIDLACDARGRLFVVDSANNRVVVFDDPVAQSTPDAVFGQLDDLAGQDVNHGLGIMATDADGLFGPTGVAVDPAGNVYVVDTNSNRLLRFDAPFAILADLNCDGAVNFDDIDGFIAALVGASAYESAWPDCHYFVADVNGDGAVNFDDIDGFITCLIVGSCT